MYLRQFLEICFNIVNGSVSLVSWLFTPLDVLGIAPAYIITFAGLGVYLTIAIVKWLAS